MELVVAGVVAAAEQASALLHRHLARPAVGLPGADATHRAGGHAAIVEAQAETEAAVAAAAKQAAARSTAAAAAAAAAARQEPAAGRSLVATTGSAAPQFVAVAPGELEIPQVSFGDPASPFNFGSGSSSGFSAAGATAAAPLPIFAFGKAAPAPAKPTGDGEAKATGGDEAKPQEPRKPKPPAASTSLSCTDCGQGDTHSCSGCTREGGSKADRPRYCCKECQVRELAAAALLCR